MIELMAEQEKRTLRDECRAWMSLLADAWYDTDHPRYAAYRPALFMLDARAVFTTCQLCDVDNIEHITQLAFNYLRARALRIHPDDTDEMVRFFLRHAIADNTAYVQDLIDEYLDRAEQEG